MTFQELARNIYEAAQFDKAANQRTNWDNEALAVKLRYQRAAKMALGMQAVHPADMRSAFEAAVKEYQNTSIANDIKDWFSAGAGMPSLVLQELSKHIGREG